MLKKSITFVDFEGARRTEDFYFNLNESEIAEMALLHEGGPDGAVAFFKDLGNSNDPKKILPAVKNIIALSVGRRVGEFGFTKKGVADEFMSSPAFNELYMELLQDGQKVVDFFNGILPEHFSKQIGQEMVNLPNHSMQELLDMTDEQFEEVAGTEIKKMSRLHLSAAMERLARVKFGNDAVFE